MKNHQPMQLQMLLKWSPAELSWVQVGNPIDMMLIDTAWLYDITLSHFLCWFSNVDRSQVSEENCLRFNSLHVKPKGLATWFYVEALGQDRWVALTAKRWLETWFELAISIKCIGRDRASCLSGHGCLSAGRQQRWRGAGITRNSDWKVCQATSV